MKYITSCLLLIMVSCLSCKKDYLQFDLGTSLPEEQVFKDPLLASRYADNAYNYMIDDFSRLNDVYKGTTGQFSDEATGSTGSTQAMWSGNYLASTDVTIIYARMYQGIRIVNTTLVKMEIVPWTSDYNPKVMKAQMLFLRGMFYFELVKRWGDVVIVPAALTPTDNTDLPRTPYVEVVTYILKDLQESEGILKSESSLFPNYSSATGEWDQANYGRVTIGAIKALKARLLLLDASPLHNATGDVNKWKAAATAAKDIIDMNKYSLHADYNTLLNVNTSPEYIMIKVRPPRAMRGALDDFIMSRGSGGAQGLLNPTQNHVDLYEAVKKNTGGQIISSAPIYDAASGYNPQNPYLNRDPRFYSNIIYNDMTWQSRKIIMYINVAPPTNQVADFGTAATYTQTRYYCRKLWPEVYKAASTSTSLINYIMFRYGEVLLNYAEALNEAEGPVSDVYKYINDIRARAGIPVLPAGLTKDLMRTRIQNERGVELAFEELRWWDVLRWKKGPQLVSQTITAMDVVKNATGFTYTVVPLSLAFQRAAFQDYMYYYPIPRTEINKSRGILKQNQGW